MAYVDWRIKGLSLTTCNCAYGCPCQFNALPTHGDCRAAVGMRVDEGHFNVFAGTLTKVHEPRFLPITWEADMESRRGHFAVEGVVDAKATLIVNASTGAEHRARVTLPTGFEYAEAEYASGTVTAPGPVRLDSGDTHAHFAILHMTPQGVVC
ncbi:MAG: DUF1326 domain-containing protein [Acidobacteria bacterium]|nr:DUF1326 domain-containing protein [Acidobacteriota bacterium]